ncbi:hypothetical protein [Agromyces arachidis]|uniref:hypothetical protein n=1 Tax=Agromyces arachidis TaxID=766966 RepID=UPI004055AFCE
MTARASLLTLLGTAIAALVAGCATPSAPATDDGLPDGLTVSVQQGRFDVPDGRLVLHFENTGEPVTVTAIEVRSPALEPGMARDRPFELTTDDAIDIRLDLTATVCDGDPAGIEIDVETASGPDARRSGVLVPDDPFDTMARIADTECLAESVAAVAAITLPERLRTTGTGSEARAWIDVGIDPVASGSGSLRIDGVTATTLIGDEDGQGWTLDLDVSPGTAPSEVALPVRPARCDAHAIADDKRGTILPFVLETDDGRAGSLEIAAGDALKADLYAYYTERCGL